jgi:lipid II:glycine glycyltransferase (peptidoglycan interpeptide bridge formation enzyme)
MISLSYKSRAFAFRGQGDKELANALHANDLLNCYRIEDACRAGCTSYNMGGSGGIPSLMAYKAKFGAAAMEFPVYTVESFPWRQITRSVESINSTTRALAGRWRQQSATKSDD